MTKSEKRADAKRQLKYGTKMSLPVSSRFCCICEQIATQGDAVRVRGSLVAHDRCAEAE